MDKKQITERMFWRRKINSILIELSTVKLKKIKVPYEVVDELVKAINDYGIRIITAEEAVLMLSTKE